MSLFEKELDLVYTSGLRRELRCVDVFDNGYCSFNNQKMLNFSSNDYLGLSSDHVLRDDFEQWLKGSGEGVAYGSGSSRLLTGKGGRFYRFYLITDKYTMVLCLIMLGGDETLILC